MNHVRPRARRTTAAALAVVAALALAGCNDDGKPKQGSRPAGPSPSATASGSGSATAPASASASTGAPASGARVDLLGTGTGPRRLLELALEEGHRETSTLDLTMRMDLGPIGMVEVPFGLTLATTVTAADDAGYETASVLGKPTVDATKVPAGLGPTLEQTLALLEGTTMRIAAGRDGAVTSTDVELPDGAPDVVARMVDSISHQAAALTVPFPREEVGVGARWRAVSTLRLSGTTSTVTSTYQLTELRDDGYTLALTVRQRTLPGAATGGGAVVGGSASGTGTLRGRTGLMLPESSRASLDGSSTVEVAGQRVRTTFGTTMRLTTR